MWKCFSHLKRGQQLIVSTFGNVFGVLWAMVMATGTEASDSEFTGYKTQIERAEINLFNAKMELSYSTGNEK